MPSVPVAGIADVTITPVTLSHLTADVAVDRQRVAYCCCGYVLETESKKMVLMWDLDNQNDWILNPQTAAHQEAIKKLSHADYLFIDCPFWYPFDKPASHTSFLEVIDIATVLRPRETRLVHLSGHPDGRRDYLPDLGAYGWTNAQWDTRVKAVWTEREIDGTVATTKIGDEFWF
ncbi:MAG: hypothetical protein AAGD96_19835 [Chloroflexota bacterium]